MNFRELSLTPLGGVPLSALSLFAPRKLNWKIHEPIIFLNHLGLDSLAPSTKYVVDPGEF